MSRADWVDVFYAVPANESDCETHPAFVLAKDPNSQRIEIRGIDPLSGDIKTTCDASTLWSALDILSHRLRQEGIPYVPEQLE